MMQASFYFLPYFGLLPLYLFGMVAALSLLLLPIYQRALLFISESTQRNYKTSGAFNLFLISQQL